MLDGRVQARHDGMAAWLVVTAPGMLLTRSVASVALIATAWLSRADLDPRLLGVVGAAYLGMQALVTLWMVRRPGRVSIMLGSACLAADAALAGQLLGGGGPAFRGAGIGVAVLAIGLAFEADGWPGAFLSGCVITVAAGAVLWRGVLPGVPAPLPLFSPALSVERSFPGAHIQSGELRIFSSLLSVETSLAGTRSSADAARRFSPVLSAERSFNGMAIGPWPRTAVSLLVVPPLLVAVLALVAGNFVSLARSRRMQAASAYAAAVARRLGV